MSLNATSTAYNGQLAVKRFHFSGKRSEWPAFARKFCALSMKNRREQMIIEIVNDSRSNVEAKGKFDKLMVKLDQERKTASEVTFENFDDLAGTEFHEF